MRQFELFDFLPYGFRVPLAAMRGLILESKEPCRTCCQPFPLNPHRMDRHKVHTLADLAKFHAEGDAWVRVESGRGLRGCTSEKWRAGPYRCDAHLERLVWFGLADKRKKRCPDARVTPRGFRFLRGELEVPERILCRGGKVEYASIEMVKLADVAGVDPRNGRADKSVGDFRSKTTHGYLLKRFFEAIASPTHHQPGQKSYATARA